MAIITKKLNDSTLKNVTKNNDTYQVNINDVSSNVISEGTQITDSVLGNINYKDDKSISFDITTNIPDSVAGKAIIYATSNGKLYCKISGNDPFEISYLTVSDIIKKKGTTYSSSEIMEYFNLNSSMKLFSTNTKVGSIPSRNEETNVITDATYIDFKNDEIEGLVEGETKLKISDESIILKNDNSYLNIDSSDDVNIFHDSNSKIELTNEKFNIKGKNTELGINNDKTKFNCYTDLSGALYGNNKYRVQIENDLKIRDITNNKDLISINQNEINILGGSNYNVKVNNINLDDYIKDKANDLLDDYNRKILITNQVTSTIYDLVLDNYSYTYIAYFSDTTTSNKIMSVRFSGYHSETVGIFYKTLTNSYYKLTQFYANFDDETDYFKIEKTDSDGNYISNAYFRGIYYVES